MAFKRSGVRSPLAPQKSRRIHAGFFSAEPSSPAEASGLLRNKRPARSWQRNFSNGNIAVMAALTAVRTGKSAKEPGHLVFIIQKKVCRFVAGFTGDDQLAGYYGVFLLSCRILPPGQLVTPTFTWLYNRKRPDLRNCHILRRLPSDFIKKYLHNNKNIRILSSIKRE